MLGERVEIFNYKYTTVVSGVARNNGCVRLFYGQGSEGSSRDLKSVYNVRN